MNQLSGPYCYIIGEDSLVIQCAEIILKEKCLLLGIISANSAIENWCKIYNIPLLKSIESLLETQVDFDYLFSIVNNKILPNEILRLPRQYAINFHNSPLPKYAGLYASTWAILNNEKNHGVSWHIMTETVDAGDTLKQHLFKIGKQETALSLNLKCYEYAVESFQELLVELKENRFIKKNQDILQRSYFGLNTKIPRNGFISWYQSAEKINRLCRALTLGNYPNLLGNPKWILDNEVLIIKDHKILDSRSNKSPGTIVSIQRDYLQVATKTNDLVILDIAYENGEICSFNDLKEKFYIYEDYQLKTVNYRHVIKRLIPGENIQRFFIMTPSEKSKITREWNSSKCQHINKKTVYQIFEEQAIKTPYQIAAIFKNEEITYEELNKKSNKLAHYLRKLGVRKENIVGLCIHRNIDMMISILGIMKAGAAYLPLESTYPTERLSYILDDSKATFLITNQSDLQNRFPKFNGKVLKLSSCLNSTNLEDIKNPKNLLTTDHLAYVIYTSGTTGTPKGVEITHLSLHNHMVWMKENYHFTENDIFIQKTPFSFDASVWEIFISSYVGGKLVIAPSNAHINPSQLVELLIQHKVTVLQVVPTMLKELLSVEELHNCKNLKHVFCGGEPLLPETIKEFFQKISIKLHNLYGPTETTIDATTLQCTPAHGEIKTSLIGKPIWNTQTYVLDQNMKIMPINVLGELYIGGRGLARGYLNQPELTQKKFCPNPFSKKKGARLYRTGDLVRWCENGNLEYLGRQDDQIKIRGCRIELNEIEIQISKFPRVHQCIVTTQEDSKGSKSLSAYILIKPGVGITSRELSEFLIQRMPSYMIPNRFYLVDSFLTTPSGKIDRKNLPSPCIALAQDTNFIPPRNDEEKILTTIWCSILKISKIGVQHNFFDLGGDSLSALRICDLISKEFSIKLSIGKLFEFPTVAELAKEIKSTKSKVGEHQKTLSEIRNSCLINLNKGDSDNLPLFLIHPIGGTVFWYKNLAKYIEKKQPLYAIQDPGLETNQLLFKSIEEMSTFYMKIIRMIQPHGPYLLGGASFGATIAIEIARQLKTYNEEVIFIALLDGWSSYEILGNNKKLFKNLMQKQNEKTLNKLIQNNLIDTDFIIELQWHREQILSYYQLPKLDVKLTLFKAQKLWEIFKESPLNGWETYSTLPIECHLVPGNHETMFYEPHVQFLAQQLSKCLSLLTKNVQILT